MSSDSLSAKSTTAVKSGNHIDTFLMRHRLNAALTEFLSLPQFVFAGTPNAERFQTSSVNLWRKSRPQPLRFLPTMTLGRTNAVQRNYASRTGRRETAYVEFNSPNQSDIDFEIHFHLKKMQCFRFSPTRLSFELCTETLTALRSVERVTRLRYPVHAAGFSAT